MFARKARWPVMAAAITGLLLSACAPTTTTGGGSPTPGASPATTVLRMARNAEPFSPFVPWQIDDNPALFISVNVYDTLLRTTKDGTNVEPGLATKWESSADGLTWTFTLRDGLKFSDGSAMKASDVKASLDMARGGEKSAWKDVYKAIKDITASDDKTVKITLSQPYAPLLSVLAMFSGGVLPADMAKATDTKDYDNTLAWKTKGTGAYYSEGWKKGDPIVLKRNTNYWKGTPSVSEVRIEYIPDDNTRVLKLQGGETDVVDFVPFSQIAALNTQPNIKAQTFSIQQTAFVILNNSKPPLNDVKVRQAINYAIPVAAIVPNVLLGYGAAMTSPVPALTPGHDATLSPYKQNLDKAKELMKQAGVTQPVTLDLAVRIGWQPHEEAAVWIQRELEKVGFKINITRQTDATFRQLASKGDLQLSIESWQSWVNDPFFHLVPLFHSTSKGTNTAFYSNPALDKILDENYHEPNAEKRLAAAKAAQKIVIDDAVWGMLWYDNWTRVMRADLVGVEKRWDTFERFTAMKLA